MGGLGNKLFELDQSHSHVRRPEADGQRNHKDPTRGSRHGDMPHRSCIAAADHM